MIPVEKLTKLARNRIRYGDIADCRSRRTSGCNGECNRAGILRGKCKTLQQIDRHNKDQHGQNDKPRMAKNIF